MGSNFPGSIVSAHMHVCSYFTRICMVCKCFITFLSDIVIVYSLYVTIHMTVQGYLSKKKKRLFKVNLF